MPRYQVRIEEIAYYVIEVEAEDEETAAAEAEEIFVQAESANEFFSHVGAREVDAVVSIDA